MQSVERWINSIPLDAPIYVQTSLTQIVPISDPKSFPDELSVSDHLPSAPNNASSISAAGDTSRGTLSYPTNLWHSNLLVNFFPPFGTHLVSSIPRNCCSFSDLPKESLGQLRSCRSLKALLISLSVVSMGEMSIKSPRFSFSTWSRMTLCTTPSISLTVLL